MLADNRTIVVPPSMTAGTTIVLRTDMAGHRIVTVLPPDVDFPARGITRIEARLAYHDPDAGLSYEDVFTFTGSRERAFFEFDYTAAERAQLPRHGTAGARQRARARARPRKPQRRQVGAALGVSRWQAPG